MYRISYRFLVPGWSAKPLVSAHDRIMGTHNLRRSCARNDAPSRQPRASLAVRANRRYLPGGPRATAQEAAGASRGSQEVVQRHEIGRANMRSSRR